MPEAPPGIWPPPNESHPWARVPDDANLQPGQVWPPLPEAAKGKFVVLAEVPGHGFHYIVIDASLKAPPSAGGKPIEEGEAQPKAQPAGSTQVRR